MQNGYTIISLSSVYLNAVVSVLVELPSYAFCMFTMDRFGRRPMLVLTQLLAGVPCLLSLFVPAAWGHTPVVVLATIAKFGTSAAYAIVILQVKSLITPLSFLKSSLV
jgi:OCT family organic cation transporter-like MFS transporter 4/5